MIFIIQKNYKLYILHYTFSNERPANKHQSYFHGQFRPAKKPVHPDKHI